MPEIRIPTLSIVIPAFNEESRLGDTLERICAFCHGRLAPGADGALPWEVLVVDDGSADATLAVALAFADRGVRALRLEENQGKGAALRHGVLATRGARVLISDADLSTPIEDYDLLLPHLARAPLVFGSRARRDSRLTRRQPFYREWMGKTFNKLIWLAGVRGVADTQCGFKLFDGLVARRLFGLLTTPGFAFDVELAWLARRLGHGISEVGVTWHNSPASRVHILIDPPKMLLEVARFRWRHRKGIVEMAARSQSVTLNPAGDLSEAPGDL